MLSWGHRKKGIYLIIKRKLQFDMQNEKKIDNDSSEIQVTTTDEKEKKKKIFHLLA